MCKCSHRPASRAPTKKNGCHKNHWLCASAHSTRARNAWSNWKIFAFICLGAICAPDSDANANAIRSTCLRCHRTSIIGRAHLQQTRTDGNPSTRSAVQTPPMPSSTHHLRLYPHSPPHNIIIICLSYCKSARVADNERDTENTQKKTWDTDRTLCLVYIK